MSNFNINKMTGISYQSISQTSKASSPDWEKIPHKGMERPSEAEFDGKIDELAKELAKARYQNDGSQYESLSAAGDKLRAQYLSLVSPDRKTMAKEASEFMKQSRSDAGNKESDKPLNLIDYLNKKDGIGEYGENGRSHNVSKSGTGTTVVYGGNDLQPDSFEIKGSKAGQTVMGYASGNWYHINTPEEQSMQKNFLARLNKAEERYYRQYVSGDTLNFGQGMEPSTEIKNKVDYLA
jgi:hypothetical protein